MHIDSGNMILFEKKAQNLEVVKTPEKFTERELSRAIRDALIAEEGAIKQYETVVDATDDAKVKSTLQDIANEEKVHVGELQKLLKDMLKDEEGFLEEGEKEVEAESSDKMTKTAEERPGGAIVDRSLEGIPNLISQLQMSIKAIPNPDVKVTLNNIAGRALAELGVAVNQYISQGIGVRKQ